jgi:hypothetical protein
MLGSSLALMLPPLRKAVDVMVRDLFDDKTVGTDEERVFSIGVLCETSRRTKLCRG